MTSSSRQQSRTPSPRSPQFSRVLTSEDVEQGHILWLAPKAETNASVQNRNASTQEPVVNLSDQRSRPDDGFYKHPILVLSRPKSAPDTIRFLHVRSFSQARSSYHHTNTNQLDDDVQKPKSKQAFQTHPRSPQRILKLAALFIPSTCSRPSSLLHSNPLSRSWCFVSNPHAREWRSNGTARLRLRIPYLLNGLAGRSALLARRTPSPPKDQT